MKIFKIINKETKEIYYVHNKIKFCTEHNLCRRVLDRTYHGERTQHKGYILADKLEVVEDENGDIFVSDLGVNVKKISQENVNHETSDIDILSKNLLISNKNNQKLSDKLRIARKVNRELIREQNISEDFCKQVIEILKENRTYKVIRPNQSKNEKLKLIVQLSDIHFGKTVNLNNNKYNFNVATERLNKYLYEIQDIVNKYNISDIYLAFTGDLFQLDERTDALLSNEDNRANSFIKGFDIILNFIDGILEVSSNVYCIGVVGNESRLKTTEYQSNYDNIANNNFDSLLFNLLKRYYYDSIIFLNNGDVLNAVLNINNLHIGLTHGDKLKHSRKDIDSYKLKLMSEYKVPIDYLIFGHIHNTLISSDYARSASTVGMDEYAFNGLSTPNGYAGQNIYLIKENNIQALEIKL